MGDTTHLPPPIIPALKESKSEKKAAAKVNKRDQKLVVPAVSNAKYVVYQWFTRPRDSHFG